MGFRKTGIHPFNPQVIPAESLTPSLVTDRELAGNGREKDGTTYTGKANQATHSECKFSQITMSLEVHVGPVCVYSILY